VLGRGTGNHRGAIIRKKRRRRRGKGRERGKKKVKKEITKGVERKRVVKYRYTRRTRMQPREGRGGMI